MIVRKKWGRIMRLMEISSMRRLSPHFSSPFRNQLDLPPWKTFHHQCYHAFMGKPQRIDTFIGKPRVEDEGHYNWLHTSACSVWESQASPRCWCNCNFGMYSLVFLMYCTLMFILGCVYNVIESCHAPMFWSGFSIMWTSYVKSWWVTLLLIKG